MDASNPASQAAKSLDLMEFARSLAPSGPDRQEWSGAEEEACAALALAALRLKSSERLEAAIEAFGGLPPTWSDKRAGHLLHACAMDPEAFGFSRVLEVYEKERPAMKRGEPRDMGEWLRQGLPNWFSIDDDCEPDRPVGELGKHAPAPVAACLATDNPVALALILSNPRMRQALAAMEPKPMGGGAEELARGKGVEIPQRGQWGRRKALAQACRDAEASVEHSLIWRAMRSGAFRCAALLAKTPDFGSAALDPQGLSFGSTRTMDRRRAQELFREEEDPGYCFFEEALQSVARVGDASYSEREGLEAAWEAMIRSCVESAPESAKAWRQEGTGMGWAEMYFSRQRPDRWEQSAARGNDVYQKKLAGGLDMMKCFEAAGFEVGWEELGACCDETQPLGAWLALRSQARIPQGPAARGARL